MSAGDHLPGFWTWRGLSSVSGHTARAWRGPQRLVFALGPRLWNGGSAPFGPDARQEVGARPKLTLFTTEVRRTIAEIVRPAGRLRAITGCRGFRGDPIPNVTGDSTSRAAAASLGERPNECNAFAPWTTAQSAGSVKPGPSDPQAGFSFFLAGSNSNLDAGQAVRFRCGTSMPVIDHRRRRHATARRKQRHRCWDL